MGKGLSRLWTPEQGSPGLVAIPDLASTRAQRDLDQQRMNRELMQGQMSTERLAMTAIGREAGVAALATRHEKGRAAKRAKGKAAKAARKITNKKRR